MKKLFALAIAALTFTAPAFADEPTNDVAAARGAVYNCRLTGAISGVKLGFGIAGQVLSGRGLIRCSANAGRGNRYVNMPVRLSVVGGGIGFDFTIVRRVNIVTAGFGAVNRPSDLLGSYSIGATSGVTLINRGYNVQSAVSVRNRANGLTFDMGFQGERAYGLGARLEGLVFSIRPL